MKTPLHEHSRVVGSGSCVPVKVPDIVFGERRLNNRPSYFEIDFSTKPDLSSQSKGLHEKLSPVGLRMVIRGSQILLKILSKSSLICDNAVT